MMEIQIQTEDKKGKVMQEEAERIHLEFLQVMHSYFGLNSAPPLALIKLSGENLVGSGRFFKYEDKSRIVVGTNNKERKLSEMEQLQFVRFICSHETAHYLHYGFLNKKFSNNHLYVRSNRLDEIARELVSEWGTHLFFRKKRETIPTLHQNTLCKILYPFLDRKNVDEDIMLILEESLLEQIAIENNLSKILEILSRCGFEGMIPYLSRWGFFI